MTCEPIIAGKFVEKVRPLIDEAVNTIDICVFDWRWYPQDPASAAQIFNAAVVRAARRGVQVRAIVNNQNVADILKECGAQTKKFVSAHLLHNKLMIIDGKTVITGSHNYTQSAFTANYELSVILNDIIGLGEIQTFFNNLWK